MLLNIKVHSTYEHLFSELSLQADLEYYQDIYDYLKTVQPRFMHYLVVQDSIGNIEPYVFLDKNLQALDLQNFSITRVKEGDVIYIVPAVIGGGGKRGGLLALVALVALFFIFPLGGAGASAGAGGAASAGGITGLFSGTGRFAGILKTIAVNVGLGLLAAMFQPKEKDAEKSRQNDAFGGLNNTTANGTPIPLAYGMPRIAGQLLSGYLNTIDHDKTDSVTAMGTIISPVAQNTSSNLAAFLAPIFNNQINSYNEYEGGR